MKVIKQPNNQFGHHIVFVFVFYNHFIGVKYSLAYAHVWKWTLELLVLRPRTTP